MYFTRSNNEGELGMASLCSCKVVSSLHLNYSATASHVPSDDVFVSSAGDMRRFQGLVLEEISASNTMMVVKGRVEAAIQSLHGKGKACLTLP